MRNAIAAFFCSSGSLLCSIIDAPILVSGRPKDHRALFPSYENLEPNLFSTRREKQSGTCGSKRCLNRKPRRRAV
jgi:hypothetical protein